MNLARLIADETNSQLDQIMLLRHSNSKTKGLLQAGATIEEYTLVQPTNSKYDFLADGKPPIQVVVAIVNERVHAVYKIAGVERVGTTRTLVSGNFRQFDIQQGYPELPAKLFRAEQLSSAWLGQSIRGWTSPRNAVARNGTRLFDRVEVD